MTVDDPYRTRSTRRLAAVALVVAGVPVAAYAMLRFTSNVVLAASLACVVVLMFATAAALQRPRGTVDAHSFRMHGTRGLGVVLMIVAVPVAWLTLLVGSGGEMIGFQSRTEQIYLATLVGLPVLLFALGGALVWNSRTGRDGLALAFALLMPVDVAALVGALWLQARSDLPVVIPPPDHDAVITGTTIVGVPDNHRRPIRIPSQSIDSVASACRTDRHCGMATVVVLDSTAPVATAPANHSPHRGSRRRASRATSPARP